MSAFGASLSMGAQLALRRMGGRTALLITLAAVSFSTLAAWAERHVNAVQAADVALRGPAFGLAIPVAALSLVAVALRHARLNDAVASIATLGGDRRAAALGALAGTSVVTGLLGALAALATALVAHGQVSAASLFDAGTAAWIGGLTGWVYAFFYGAASSIGKRGGGRIALFLADLVLGPLVGMAAVVFPRAHGLNLLGASPVLDLPQVASTVILVLMACAFSAAAALRVRS